MPQTEEWSGWAGRIRRGGAFRAASAVLLGSERLRRGALLVSVTLRTERGLDTPNPTFCFSDATGRLSFVVMTRSAAGSSNGGASDEYYCCNTVKCSAGSLADFS